MNAKTSLRLAYYGDDFTGSTDALEFLTRAGLRARLYLEAPTMEELARSGELDAIGVAGVTRSLGLAEMETKLRQAFLALRTLGAPHVHYKVCSTFDSSPTVGSIGRAIEVGADVFRSKFVPLVVGAPALGRYCVFGNLFARFGIGSAGEIHRLDRHPSMSRHPVTPADESDLRLHLAKQTSKRVALLDVLRVALPVEEARRALESLLAEKPDVVLFDALSESHLNTIGALLDNYAKPDAPLFSVGSSAIEMALGAHWREAGRATPKTQWTASAKKPVLAVSGSCSPVTTGQLQWAMANGFRGILFNADKSIDAVASEAAETLRSGISVAVYTHCGEPISVALAADRIGGALGEIARKTLAKTNGARLLVAGGDTSSYAARALGIHGLDMLRPLAPGAPLCRAHAPGSPVDGHEVNIKGGQVGAANYFGAVERGAL